MNTLGTAPKSNFEHITVGSSWMDLRGRTVFGDKGQFIFKLQ